MKQKTVSLMMLMVGLVACGRTGGPPPVDEHTRTWGTGTPRVITQQVPGSFCSAKLLAGGLPIPQDPQAARQIKQFNTMRLQEGWAQLQDGCPPVNVVVLESNTHYRKDIYFVPEQGQQAERSCSQKASDLVPKNYDKNNPGTWHGTAVNGVIAETAGDGFGGFGVGWNLLRVLNSSVGVRAGLGFILNHEKATWCSPAFGNPYSGTGRIVNISYGLSYETQAPTKNDSEIVQPWVDQGFVFVNSFGQFDQNVTPGDPKVYVFGTAQKHSDIITVGWVNQSGVREPKAFAGSYIDFVGALVVDGQGCGLWGLRGKDDYVDGCVTGTSFTAPTISGLIGLLFYKNQQQFHQQDLVDLKATHPGVALDELTKTLVDAHQGDWYVPVDTRTSLPVRGKDVTLYVMQCLKAAAFKPSVLQRGIHAQPGAADYTRGVWNPEYGYGLVDASMVLSPTFKPCTQYPYSQWE